MKHFDTLIDAINHYKSEGYNSEFLVENKSLVCREDPSLFPVDEFEVDSIYRFEGDSDPTDGSIMYAIRHKTNGIKGLLSNGYGIYADQDVSDVMILLGRKL
ncbi:MAG: hypothetical protein ACI86M_000694 [Saprospiraceae bacterium]|jgi:hypothetical protein